MQKVYYSVNTLAKPMGHPVNKKNVTGTERKPVKKRIYTVKINIIWFLATHSSRKVI